MPFTDEDSVAPGSPFTDSDLKRLERLLKADSVISCDEVVPLLARLDSAERSAKSLEAILNWVVDEPRSDCQLCGVFLSRHKDICDVPKALQALEAWRRAKGEKDFKAAGK